MIKILVCIIIILIVVNIRYKMQIKDIYEQVEFIQKHKTNKIISKTGNIRSINRLIDRLNELIQLQKELSSEYKVKDERLKETITNISHDIRTPLTSLNGYFQLLVESESAEERDRYLKIIETRIINLRKILENMFTYMKIQDKKYHLKKEACHLNKILYDNLFAHYEDFNSKKIEPDINLPNEKIIINSNSLALDRIINNLINNSLLHGQSYIGVSLLKKDTHVNIIFKNDVEDIKEIDIENIFTRFYKKDTARTINSTGLGLTIVKELVELIEGKIVASVDDNIFKIEIRL